MLYRTLTIVSMIFFLLTCRSENNRATITINVKSENISPQARIHIVGNQKQLGRWKRDHKYLTQQDSVWTTSVSARINSEFAFKVTRGRWHFEAVDSNGVELPNVSFRVTGDTTIFLKVMRWRDQVEGPPLISKQRFENKGWTIELFENWKYHAGDDSSWAAPDFDDSDWQPIRTQMRDRRGRRPPARNESQPDTTQRRRHSRPQWDGIGWFRLRVWVDSSVVNFPLSLHMRQNGASEIYLNGNKLYTFGKVSSIADLEKIYTERNPKPIIFDRPGEHLIAVRYSFHKSERLIDIPNERGFDMWLGHLENAITARTDQVRSSSFNQLVFTAIPLSFALMHILLFVFYRQNKNNLYYALSMFFFAVMAYTQFGRAFTTTSGAFFWLIILEILSAVLAIAFGVFSVYATIYKKLPATSFIPFTVLILLFAAVLLFEQFRSYFHIVLYIFLFLSLFDMVRLTFTSRKLNKEWNWIISGGFTLTLLIFAYQSLLGLGILLPIGGKMLVWIYSIPVLAISLSTYISLNFSRAHKDLAAQLERVEQLSEEKLQQERRAKDEEIQRRLLEADNARKTKELEKARQLQLSMLPKEIPRLPGIDIAVSMKTATEVGGDYYDFYTDGDGQLTIAIGDATGHGMQAGTMVAAIKSLFSADGHIESLPERLATWSRIIRQMNFGNLYMAMMLLRIEKNKIIMSNAGMPPALLYRGGENKVREIVLKGMPLGGAVFFDYDERTLSIEPGDTLLLMSDGFIELFNEKNELFDVRAVSAFEKSAHLSPEAILENLHQEGRDWRGNRAQNDDITFVVMKFR